MKFKYIIFIFCILFVNVYAQSPVWKISKNGSHLFIAGTIHLLNKNDYPLPKAFDYAYKRSSTIVFEADTNKFSQASFRPLILRKTLYSKNKTLEDYLDYKTLKELKVYLKKENIPYSNVAKFKPGMLSITLMMQELKKLSLLGIGVDEYYSKKALKDKKKIKFLESVFKQLDFLSNMGKNNESAFVKYMLKDLNNIEKEFSLMKEAWRQGNNEALKKVSLDSWKDKFPKLYHSLLIKRNKAWMPKIVKMLANKEVEFILFGALHLVGEHGVLSLLEKKGYKVENIN
ncbi:MAG: TraB/GumN family protein [Arcobacter sp.]|nr:MAG: TraB/GumN family protein [Arcobacter sp.]